MQTRPHTKEDHHQRDGTSEWCGKMKMDCWQTWRFWQSQTFRGGDSDDHAFNLFTARMGCPSGAREQIGSASLLSTTRGLSAHMLDPNRNQFYWWDATTRDTLPSPSPSPATVTHRAWFGDIWFGVRAENSSESTAGDWIAEGAPYETQLRHTNG